VIFLQLCKKGLKLGEGEGAKNLGDSYANWS